MKNLFKKLKTKLLAIMVLASMLSYGQTPDEINYQMTVRDNSNQLVTNQNIGLKISLHESAANGNVIYSETQNVQTSTYGLANLKIGTGTVVTGSFSNLNWSVNDYFIEIAIDLTGGTNYSSLGVIKFATVPYAFAAKDVINKQQLSINGNVITLSDGGSITLPNGGGNGDNWGTQVVVTDNTISGDGTAALPLSAVGVVGPQGPAGATGPQGATGNDGTNGTTGAQGPTGPQGATGPAGSGVTIQGSDTYANIIAMTGTTGDMWIVSTDALPNASQGDGMVWDGTTWNNVGPIRGPQGPQGATGAQGAQGPAGNNGATGPQGLAGTTGPTGPQGPIGLTGATGPTGPDDQTLSFNNTTGLLTIADGNSVTLPLSTGGDNWGTQVVVSDATISGDGTVSNPLSASGATGPQGPIGLTGATGPQGPAGNDGANGAPGPVGPAGLTGPAGPQGATGPAGPQGPAGPDDQNLTLSNDTLYIENGNNVYLPSSGANTLDQAYDQGGAGAGNVINATDGAVKILGTDGLYVTGTANSGSNVEISGTGTRMFFNPNKSAFRVGTVNGNHWDNDSIGDNSFASGKDTKATANLSTAMGSSTTASGYSSTAMGNNTTASGSNSTAMGVSTKALGSHSTAMGVFTKALGSNSTAMGAYTTASGIFSTVMGDHTTASNYASTVVGMFNDPISSFTNSIDNTMPLFIVGNGDNASSLSNAMVVRKDGKVGIGSTATQDRLKVNSDSLENPFRVQVDGSTKMRIFSNGSIALGTNNSNVGAGDVYVHNDLGVGVDDPAEKLDVNGAIKVGNTTNTNTGAIRWSGTDFEGYTGTEWVSLTKANLSGWGSSMNTAAENSSNIGGGPTSEYGFSVAISGDYAIVGAPYYDNLGNTNQGRAYILKRIGTGSTWMLQATLSAGSGAAQDKFGYSVDIDGDYAIIGAPYNDIGSATDKGSAYVFKRNGTNWSQQAALVASGGTTGDKFGWSVSISGTYAVIGAPFNDIGSNNDEGAVYVFHRSGTSWSQNAALTQTTGHTNDHFGSSVNIDGQKFIAGSPNWEPGSLLNIGTAYIYFHDGPFVSSPWNVEEQLLAPGSSSPSAGDHFGTAVALDGDYTVIGVKDNDISGQTNQGSAYVFHRIVNQFGPTWISQGELIAEDGKANDVFGYSVAISGSNVVIGAEYYLSGGNSKGSAYVYERSGTSWNLSTKIVPSDSANDDKFGCSVGIDGNTAIIGAKGWNSHAGKVYFIEK